MELLDIEELKLVHSLLKNEEITEILINSAQDIYFEHKGGLQKYEKFFESVAIYNRCIEKITQSSNSFLNREKPFLETQIGDWRVTLVYSEISGHSSAISFRRRSSQNWSLRDLLQTDWCGEKAYTFLQNALSEKRNILVVGATSSGKTTVLQAFLNSLPQTERLICIEDTAELRMPNRASLQLLSRPFINQHIQGVDLQQLVTRALRLRPDRIILGEVRSIEAYTLLMALSTGHKGSFCTLHASQAKEALIRLEMLIQLGAPQWSQLSIRRLIALTVDLIVTVEKNGETRKLKDLHRVSSVEETGITLEKLLTQ